MFKNTNKEVIYFASYPEPTFIYIRRSGRKMVNGKKVPFRCHKPIHNKYADGRTIHCRYDTTGMCDEK